ncbi:MAG: DUF3392 family protein [Akkermansiaceae bacterium]|nr:DUF3392 family protein [Akkermansiaceae bacterium]
MTYFLELTTSWVRPHLHLISLAYMATLLVLYGTNIIRFMRKMMRPWHLFFRVLALMVVCAFGFGWATEQLTLLLRNYLFAHTGIWTGVVVFLSFVALAILADRKNHV